MGNDGNIVVLSGLKPLHSFDLWGVVIDQYVLGEQKVRIFKKMAMEDDMPENEIERIVRDYRDFLDGKAWTRGLRRTEIIDALGGEALAHRIRGQYASAFMQDALAVMKEIIEAGEGVMVFTSKPAPGLGKQLAAKLGESITVRWGDKSDPVSFKVVYDLERSLGNRLVSHTADELPELVKAIESGLFQQTGLIYVNRNDSNSEDDVRKQGIDCYVNDLRNVKYTNSLSNRSLLHP